MAQRPVVITGTLTFLDEQPGGPNYPSQGPGFPTHPIAPGGPGWGGGQPVYPSHPIYNPPYPSTGPGFPTHPIAPGGGGQPPYPSQGLPPFPSQGLPGSQPHPDQGLPGQPPYPSQGPGFPTHPIVIPPGQPPPSDIGGRFELRWSPMYGWVLVPVEEPGGPTTKPLPPTEPPVATPKKA